MIGFFTGGSGGGHAGNAAMWLDDKIAPPSDLTFELATFALCWDHLIEVDELPEGHLEAAYKRCQERLRKAGTNFSNQGDQGSEWNMWKFLVENLRDEGDLARPDGSTTVPDFVGHGLHAAQFQLQQLGIPYQSADASADGSRVIWNEKNWRVVAQFPLPGAELEPSLGLTLMAAKHGENVNKHRARERARELAHEATSESLFVDD